MLSSHANHPINTLRSFYVLFCKVMPYLEATTALTVPTDATHITEAHRHTVALTTDDIHLLEEDTGLTDENMIQDTELMDENMVQDTELMDENMVQDTDHATDQAMYLDMPLAVLLGDADHFVWLVKESKSTKINSQEWGHLDKKLRTNQLS